MADDPDDLVEGVEGVAPNPEPPQPDEPPLAGEPGEGFTPSTPDQAEAGQGEAGVQLTALARDAIAEQAAMGLLPSEIARHHQLPVDRISRLLRRPSMKELVDRKRQHLLEAGGRVMFRFLLHADTLAQAQLECAFSPGPDQFKARTWILERIVPNRSVQQQQVDVNLAVHHEVLVGIKSALEKSSKLLDVKPSKATEGIKLIEGKDALPPLEPTTDPT